MAGPYYVTTSEHGTEHTPDGDLQWLLPAEDASQPAEATEGPRLVLRQLSDLIDVLDDAIFTAEPLTDGEEQRHGELIVTSARLLQRTPWGPASAALFALDCAAHVLGDMGDVELPVGFTLASAIADARSYLHDATDEVGVRLGRLARFSAARRLRRTGAKIGEIALAMFEEDISSDLDANSDPTWATTTAAGDAVLAAVEALRHIAAPRYIAAREEAAEHEEPNDPGVTPSAWQTPWGPIMVGAEHESPYLSAGALARETAFRAREAVGLPAEVAERAYQASRLAEILESA
jgi:hypothetical protein